MYLAALAVARVKMVRLTRARRVHRRQARHLKTAVLVVLEMSAETRLVSRALSPALRGLRAVLLLDKVGLALDNKMALALVPLLVPVLDNRELEQAGLLVSMPLDLPPVRLALGNKVAMARALFPALPASVPQVLDSKVLLALPPVRLALDSKVRLALLPAPLDLDNKVAMARALLPVPVPLALVSKAVAPQVQARLVVDSQEVLGPARARHQALGNQALALNRKAAQAAAHLALALLAEHLALEIRALGLPLAAPPLAAPPVVGL